MPPPATGRPRQEGFIKFASVKPEAGVHLVHVLHTNYILNLHMVVNYVLVLISIISNEI